MMDALSTLAVHAGRAQHGLGHAPPIDLSSTWRLPDPAAATASLDAMAAGGLPLGNPVYARLHNPTVGGFERAMAALEGAEASVAFGSGMAAITALVLAVVPAGGEVLAVRPVYGGTDHLLSSGLLGRRVRWVRPEALAGAIGPDTGLVMVETPANPTLDLVDVAAVVAAAGDVPVAVDATFATPLRLRPLDHGARFAVHSATKFLGGHGDVVAGVVSCSERDAAALRQVRVATGGVLHPLGGYLLHRGLQTLPVRLDRAEATATALAGRLSAHPLVRAVHHPSLPGGDPLGLLGRQLSGPGAVLAFELASAADARALMQAMRLIVPAVSLGSVDTLIQHPASLTHRVVSEEGKAAGGVSPGLLRLSVGLEDAEDLWADLAQGLRSLQVPAAAK
jgi:cystathionine beta-lyase/cystathionine gamma-synthase